MIQFFVSGVKTVFIFCLQIKNPSFQGARQLFSPHSNFPAVRGWDRMGIILGECHILLNFHSWYWLWDIQSIALTVNSKLVFFFFNLVSSGQRAHIFWWLVVIYLPVIINMEELSDCHMSNRNLSYVSVEKTNHIALQIKLCFLNSSAFLDKT